MTYPTDNTTSPGDVERWMIAWIRAHWPRGEWASLPPADVAGQALHAWQHSVDNPGRFTQGKLL